VRGTDPRPDPAAPAQQAQPAQPAQPALAAPAARAAAARDHPADPLAVRVAAGVLISAFAVGLALVEAFLVPLRVGTVPLPISVLLAVAGNVVLTKLAVRQTGSIVWGVLQPVLWLLVIVVLSLPRAEGDLVVPGSVTGLVFLFAGAVAGAYGVASEITRRAAAASRTRR
jgi:hypothetical protein